MNYHNEESCQGIVIKRNGKWYCVKCKREVWWDEVSSPNRR